MHEKVWYDQWTEKTAAKCDKDDYKQYSTVENVQQLLGWLLWWRTCKNKRPVEIFQKTKCQATFTFAKITAYFDIRRMSGKFFTKKIFTAYFASTSITVWPLFGWFIYTYYNNTCVKDIFWADLYHDFEDQLSVFVRFSSTLCTKRRIALLLFDHAHQFWLLVGD